MASAAKKVHSREKKNRKSSTKGDCFCSHEESKGNKKYSLGRKHPRHPGKEETATSKR